MRTVTVTGGFPGSVPEVQARWDDPARWPQWVDECNRVLEVSGEWPRPGSTVIWESGPAGRGRVTERVVEYEFGRGRIVELEDDSIRGRQSVVFAAEPGGVRISLGLAYELKRRTPVTGVVDLLFIKRAMAVSLGRTLSRFGGGLQAASRAPT